MKNWKTYYLSAAPYLVLALALLATYFGWSALDRAVDERIGHRFREEADETTRIIESRLHAYELMLRGGLGLFLASSRVSRAEFKSYVDILSLKQNYPGVQAFGYAEIIPGDALAAHEQQMRAEGFPGYATYPAGPRASYANIVYIEPLDARTRRAMGYDVSSEAVRRAALEQARDSGNAAITGKIRLVQEPDEDVQPGFSMFLPFYKGGGLPANVEERRARVAGFIYAPFRMYDLMRGILEGRRIIVSFAIYDGAEPAADHMLYDSALPGAGEGRHRAQNTIDIGGRRWTLSFTDSAAFRAANDSFDPQAAAIGGILVSLILFALTLLLRRMLFERRLSAEAMVQSERKLAQAQKMESIGHLTGGVAHDFNNLLQVILGNNDMLVEELADRPQLRAMAEMSRAAAERGAELTHRLLSFARKQPLDPKATDLNRLVVEMDALLRRTLGAQVEVVSVLGGSWAGLLDAPQMESAILNLCLNARDAMPNGGRVTLETANAELDESYRADNAELVPGDYVMVAVSDSGCGMDHETLARACEPFFTTKDVGQGSGLGLSMVYGFVQQSKGHLKIDSAPGAGTTVTLYLPRATTETADAAVADDAAELPGGTEKILLVEDDDMVREHVARQLRGLGYRVVSVVNAVDAVNALRQFPDIDLLFTDIVMPGGMNGRELAEQALRARPGLRVLFTSGYTENAWAERDYRDGGAPLLQKPYRRRDLAQKLRAILAPRAVAAMGK
jgi:signal transduction histidine kinase/ActR/RegA family two-component response regulator